MKKCRTRRQVRQALNELPFTLHETYDRILQNIPAHDASVTRHILQWLAFSVSRPLTFAELAVAVAFDPTAEHLFNEEDVIEDHDDVVAICGSLVIIVGERTYTNQDTSHCLALAHYSVKDYLISEHLAEACPAFALNASSAIMHMAQVRVQCL